MWGLVVSGMTVKDLSMRCPSWLGMLNGMLMGKGAYAAMLFGIGASMILRHKKFSRSLRRRFGYSVEIDVS